MTSKLDHNAQEIEERLKKTTVAEAQKSVGSRFITIGCELGPLSGQGSNVEIMNGLIEDLEFEDQSDMSATPSLNEFLGETGMN